jgi:hypothetical protein
MSLYGLKQCLIITKEQQDIMKIELIQLPKNNFTVSRFNRLTIKPISSTAFKIR